MNKHARLLALLLALAPLGYTAPASAKPSMCERAANAIGSIDGNTNPFFYFWVTYYAMYCEG